jgi:hypothetical protein
MQIKSKIAILCFVLLSNHFVFAQNKLVLQTSVGIQNTIYADVKDIKNIPKSSNIGISVILNNKWFAGVEMDSYFSVFAPLFLGNKSNKINYNRTYNHNDQGSLNHYYTLVQRRGANSFNGLIGYNLLKSTQRINAIIVSSGISFRHREEEYTDFIGGFEQ